MRECIAFEISRYEQFRERLKNEGYILTPLNQDGLRVSNSMGNVGEIVQRKFLIIYSKPLLTEYQRLNTSKLVGIARNF